MSIETAHQQPDRQVTINDFDNYANGILSAYPGVRHEVEATDVLVTETYTENPRMLHVGIELLDIIVEIAETRRR